MRCRLLFVVALWAPLCLSATASASVSEEIVIEAKKTVVNIDMTVTNALSGDSAGRAQGTGFIVDAERGIVATNRHVTGTSPTQVKVTFENGESTDAKILYYDPWHDFAFYRLNLSKVSFPLHQARLEVSHLLEEQNEVFLVGNNDAEEYSVKFGRVTNLVVDKGERHSATFQTSFDRTGGSSGSPVMNNSGGVVGIHFKGNDTTSFELRIEYVSEALRQLVEHGDVHRGDVGIELDVMHISDARKHFHLPDKVADKVGELRKDIKRVLYIDRLVAGTHAQKALRAGDIVLTLEGEMLGDDIYRFDHIVDQHVGKSVTLVVYRNGKRLTRTLKVRDAQQSKVRRFASFAGGVFHDPTTELRRKYEIDTRGAFLSQAAEGSSMASLGYSGRRSSSSRLVMVEEVNGVPTPDLASLVEALKPLKHDEHVYFLVRDIRSYRSGTNAKKVSLHLKFSPLKVFQYNETTLDWDER